MRHYTLFIKKYLVSFVECKHTPGRPYKQNLKQNPIYATFVLPLRTKIFELEVDKEPVCYRNIVIMLKQM
jgi:hypothetical protein